VAVVVGGDEVQARAVDDAAALAVGIRLAVAVRQSDPATAHGRVAPRQASAPGPAALAPAPEAPGPRRPRHPTAVGSAERGDVVGMDAERSVRIALPPGRGAEDLVRGLPPSLPVAQRE